MAKKKPTHIKGEPYMLHLSINGEEVQLPLEQSEALKLYIALQYYISVNYTEREEFLN